MTAPNPSTRPDDDEILGALDGAFCGKTVVSVLRRPYRYATSFLLEELRVKFADGSVRSLILKDLSWDRLGVKARLSKPEFLYEPRRELETYREILEPFGIGPRCYATGYDVSGRGGWLILEKVRGVELWQLGDTRTWEWVAGWVASMHSLFLGRCTELQSQNPYLLHYDFEWFRSWAERARETILGSADPRTPELVAVLNDYDKIAGTLAALPGTFVHGEFFPSNVLVELDAHRPHVWPVDWEMAAIGPGLLDAAALVTGWDPKEREGLVAAYRQAMIEHGVAMGSHSEVLEGVAMCQLHLALQWLGWAKNWTPPPEHARDWVGDSAQISERAVIVSETKVLIVNADDFGQSPGINQGVIDAHEKGIVTSATLMVRWPSATEAVEYVKGHPELSLGLHLDLAEWNYKDGGWVARYEVAPSDDEISIRDEIQRQIDSFLRIVGQPPTHIDSHQHVHRHEPVTGLLAEAGGALRVPVRDMAPGLTYCGAFYGQDAKGHPIPEAITVESLVSIIEELPEGITELGCHPGDGTGLETMYSHERAVEVATLCDPRVRSALAECEVQLRSFTDLIPLSSQD